MLFKKYIIFLSSIVLTLGLSVSPAFADTYSTDFESPTYTTGTIHGQDGWNSRGSAGLGCALFDHAVSSQSLYPSFDGQSFRTSDAVTASCFADQTFAKPLTDAVGETAATAGSFSAGTKQRHFEMQFDIASTVPGSQQSGMRIAISPDRGDGSRMSYLRIEDGSAGINVFFRDVQGTTNPANFVETQIATGLDRTATHKVKLTMDMLDGASNDVVKVYIDDALVHTGTSWENYYRYDSESSAEQSPRIIKTVMWRSAGTANSGNAGNGFFFDNLSLFSGPIPQQLDLHDKTANEKNLTNNNSTSISTASLAFASSSAAADFVGSSTQTLSVPNNTLTWQQTGNFTIEFWFKTNNDEQYLTQAGGSATKASGWFVYMTGGKPRFYSGRNTGTNIGTDYQYVDTTAALNDGNWHHIAYTYDGTNLKSFVDGSLDKTVSWGYSAAYATPSYDMISGRNLTGTVEYPFTGKMDEFRIWSTARTATEIASNKSIELSGSESRLAAYYPFETIPEPRLSLKDGSTNGNNLTNNGANNGAAILASALPFASSSAAVDFSGPSVQHLTVPSGVAAWQQTGNFTVEFWAKTVATEQYLAQSGGHPTRGVGWFIYMTDGKPRFYSGRNTGDHLGTDYQYVDTTAALNDGNWHHIAYTYDGTNLKSYVDGSLDKTVSWGYNAVYPSTSYNMISGRNLTGTVEYPFTGNIDEFRIWSTARTETQINNNMSIELTGRESGLAAYYPFELL